MKRVKLMLMAILALAVAGGTLSFKAKFKHLSYCTAGATTVGANWTCEGFAHDGFCTELDSDLTDDGPYLITLCTAEVQPGLDPCPDDLECEGTTELAPFR